MHITNHAEQRLQQRGMREEDVDLIRAASAGFRDLQCRFWPWDQTVSVIDLVRGRRGAIAAS
jgi:hypothetical protein